MRSSAGRTGILVALLLGAVPLLGAGGRSEQTTAPPRSPQQLAVEHYNNGLEHRDQARAYEKRAAQSEADKAEKLVAKAATEYRRAADEFRTALEHDPRMYQALSDLGYVLRRSGSYADALDAYDQALAIAPDYAPAIEYRGEAYLALDRIEQAKQAYEALAPLDPEQATSLVAAMRRWIEHRRVDPGELDSSTIEAFERWVASRDGSTWGQTLSDW